MHVPPNIKTHTHMRGSLYRTCVRLARALDDPHALGECVRAFFFRGGARRRTSAPLSTRDRVRHIDARGLVAAPRRHGARARRVGAARVRAVRRVHQRSRIRRRVRPARGARGAARQRDRGVITVERVSHGSGCGSLPSSRTPRASARRVEHVRLYCPSATTSRESLGIACPPGCKATSRRRREVQSSACFFLSASNSALWRRTAAAHK